MSNPRRRAQALVEMALVLPVLVMFLALFVDVARFLHVQLMLEQVTSDAARYATVKDANTGAFPTAGDVTARVASNYPSAFLPYSLTVNLNGKVGTDAAVSCALSTTVNPFVLSAVGVAPHGVTLSSAATQPLR